MTEFQPFPKLHRLNRNIIITEKIDGTNAQIFVPGVLSNAGEMIVDESQPIMAGSRKRWVTPDADNFGFAKWVQQHADELRQLGPGRHFGEWWGAGIQRGYGLAEKRFSLFNADRWSDPATRPKCCDVVPTLGRYGTLDSDYIAETLQLLRESGSQAAPGFMEPEGIVVFHAGAHVGFKVTLENDELPKSLVAEALAA